MESGKMTKSGTAKEEDIKQDAVVVDHRRVKMDEIVFVLVFLCYSYAM